ncbi:ABC transporter substrate-binding protein [Rhodoferax sp. TS-BS-61-7]|uniref:substrate-binding periplasmic protein n=1 Tax=Rhodoferax sp. TS-BS-61-7 TaxID=2094194 RepID=UPI000CF72F23|nr:transporter substrate-binding domain-containing protein [Rhodoferax sp. TS-BS-61-7]PQA78109.1 hypothetical protein C5F53_07190 [Rhodoferax sp. TS-BS-61-7]
MLAGLLVLPTGPLLAQTPQGMVLGTSRPDGSYAGRMLRRTFQELFRRLGVPLEMKVMPSARLTVELAADRIDGEVARPLAFADSQPGLVRVEEPIMTIGFALWSIQPRPLLLRLDQLADSGLSVNFTRGVVECERLLQGLLPPQRVVDVTTTVNALTLLQMGRNDVHCGIDAAVLSDAGSAELAGLPPPIKLFSVGEAIPLYFYLQRKHAALVPQIDAVLKKMKAEGVLEQIRRETLVEYKLAPVLKPVAPAR